MAGRCRLKVQTAICCETGSGLSPRPFGGHGFGTSRCPKTCCSTSFYYAEGVSGDLDNLLKPIQDALQGIAYNDDKQVRELKGARRDIDASYKVRFMPAVLGAAFTDGRPFIHIRLWRSLETRELS